MRGLHGDMGAGAASGGLSEKVPRWASSGFTTKKRRKWLWIGIALAALLAVGLAVGLGVGYVLRIYFVMARVDIMLDSLTVRKERRRLPLPLMTNLARRNQHLPLAVLQHRRLPRPLRLPVEGRGRSSHLRMDRR